MEKRAEELFERGVKALERLAEEPELEIPTSPPICPNCGTLDPVVAVSDSSGTGKMSQYYITACCMSCQFTFLVVPQGWVNFANPTELKEFLERAENGAHSTAAN